MKRQQTESHVAWEHCWDSECFVPGRPVKGPQPQRLQDAFINSFCRSAFGQQVAALSLSGGCSIAPPDQRLRQPWQPGARPSSLLLPTGFLRCSEDLQPTPVEARHGKQEPMWQRGSWWKLLTWKFVRQIEAQFIQNLGHNGVAGCEAEKNSHKCITIWCGVVF